MRGSFKEAVLPPPEDDLAPLLSHRGQRGKEALLFDRPSCHECVVPHMSVDGVRGAPCPMRFLPGGAVVPDMCMCVAASIGASSALWRSRWRARFGECSQHRSHFGTSIWSFGARLF